MTKIKMKNAIVAGIGISAERYTVSLTLEGILTELTGELKDCSGLYVEVSSPELKNPQVLATVREGETTLDPIQLPHLEEAIDQMETFVATEKDKRRKMWAGEILESMRKVCWDLEKYEK